MVLYGSTKEIRSNGRVECVMYDASRACLIDLE